MATGAGMGTNSHLFYFLAILASGEVASALIPELQEEITSLISNNSPPTVCFLTGDPKQNVNSFMTPVYDSVFNALSRGSLGFVLHGSPINRHCKDSYWLLKNFHQSENG